MPQEGRFFRCRCGAPIPKLGEFVLEHGGQTEDFCSKEHLDIACRELSRGTILTEAQLQTNQKCRDFGMPPYHVFSRPFPRQTGDP